MKVSVIMAALNQGDWVRHTVEQVKNGIGDLDHEIIVVDDHSVDNCCTGLPKDVLVIRPERRAGVSGSRILAASKAQGDMFLFTDPHCDYPENALKDLCTIAYGKWAIYQPKTVTSWKNIKRPRFGGRLDLCPRGLRVGRQYEQIGDNPALIGTIYAVRRDVYEFLGGWPKLPGYWGCSEQALTLMAWFAGCPIKIDTRHICCHHDYHPVKANGKQTFAYSVPLSSHADNCHFVHAAYFPTTYNHYWKPMIDSHFERAKTNHRKLFKSEDFQRHQALVFQRAVHDESEWFNRVMGMQIPMPTPDVVDENYVNQQRRKSKPKDYPTTRRQKRAMQWMKGKMPGCYKQKRVLDLGSRDGYAVQYAKEGMGAHEVTGIELVPETAEYARSKGRHVLAGNMENLDLPNGHYHIVQAIHSLEHTQNPKAALNEMVRVCSPGGWLLVVVPVEDKPDKRHAHNACWSHVRFLKRTVSKISGVDTSTIVGEQLHCKDKDELLVAFRKAR